MNIVLLEAVDAHYIYDTSRPRYVYYIIYVYNMIWLLCSYMAIHLYAIEWWAAKRGIVLR